MNAMLYDVVQHGTGRGAILSDREVAGKTGTSSEFRDAWFIGFTSDVVTGVWVGNDDFKPMRKVTGGTLPAQIWKTYMTAAVRNTPPVALAKALPQPEPNYAAYGDYHGAPTQDGSNGFFIEVPGFIRDLFGADDGSGDGRDLDRARERVREMNGRTEDRMQYEDPYAADARVPPPPPSSPPQNFATPQPTWNEDLFTAPPPRDLEAERRQLAERDQAFRAPFNPYMVPQPPPPPAAYRAPMPRDLPPIDRFGPSDMPPVDRPDDFAARSNDVPDRDVYQRDLDPGYYQNDVPPLPPPPIDPPFNWTR
jgi:hypothetical protein